MPHNKTVGNLALAGYDDIFNVSAGNISGEQIISLPISELHAPEIHPFYVKDDSNMARLVNSVKRHGVREPGIARPRADGGYELLCGNRRKRACELAEITTMPVIVREFDDADAVLVMVDSNLEQRDKLLPSERAQAFRMMMEALNHKGIKSDKDSYEVLFERTGIKKSQLFRTIRLTELIAALIDKVDDNQLAFNPAVELSYLTVKQQTAVAEAMAAHQVKPSLSQAVRLKKLNQSGELAETDIDAILSEEKKPQKKEPRENTKYHRFFPQDYSPQQIDKIIVKLLTDWQSKTEL